MCERRYLAWNRMGECEAFTQYPEDVDYDFGWWGNEGTTKVIPELSNSCPGEWDERVYDMEDENDCRLIEALMTL